jgi:hypothetical protein
MLVDFDLELQIEIFARLHSEDLKSLMQTNKTFQSILNIDYFWKQRVFYLFPVIYDITIIVDDFASWQELFLWIKQNLCSDFMNIANTNKTLCADDLDRIHQLIHLGVFNVMIPTDKMLFLEIKKEDRASFEYIQWLVKYGANIHGVDGSGIPIFFPCSQNV